MLRSRASCVGLLARAAAQLDVEAGAGERDGERGAPRAGADDGGAAQRRGAAEPLPLEHHAGPDAIGDGRGELARGRLDAREGERAPGADADLARADAPAAAHVGRSRSPRSGRRGRRSPARGARRRAWPCPSGPGRTRVPSGKISTQSPRARIALRGVDRVLVGVAAVDREGAERVEDPRLQAIGEQLLLGDVVDRPPHHRADHERVEEAAVVGGEDDRPVLRDVLAPDAREAEVEMEERLEDRADEPVDDRVDAALAGAPVQGGRASIAVSTRGARGPLQCAHDGDRPRDARCEGRSPAASPPASGRPAAARQARVRRAATTTSSCSAGASPGRRAPAGIRSGSRCTCGNGALFGAVYANVAPRAAAARRGAARRRRPRWPSTSPLAARAPVRPLPPRARRAAAPDRQPPRVLAGGLAPPAVRRRARRARARLNASP